MEIEERTRRRKMLQEQKKNMIIAGLTSLLVGVLVYFPILTDWLNHPDGTICGNFYRSFGEYLWECGHGRFGLVLFAKMKGLYINPTMSVMLSIFFIAVSGMLLVAIYQIKSMGKSAALGLVLVLSPTFMCTFTYYFCTDAYLFSFLLSVVAMACFHFWPNYKGCLLGSLFICASLSLYQSNIFVTACLCMFYLIFQIFDKSVSIKDLLKRACSWIITAIVAVIEYFVLLRFFQKLWQFELMEGRGFSTMGEIALSEFPTLFRTMISEFYGYFFGMTMLNNYWKARNVINIILFICLFVICGQLIYLHILNKEKIILLIVALLLLPLTCTGIILISPKVEYYILMCAPLHLLYVFIIMLLDKVDMDCIANSKVQKGVRCVDKVIIVAFVALCYVLIMYAGVFQSAIKMNLNKTYAIANRIVTQVEMQEPEIQDSLVMVHGNFKYGNYPDSYQQEMASYILNGTSACDGVVFNSGGNATGIWSGFLRDYLGIQWNYVGADDYYRICETPEFKEMPIYPEKGSIKKIDNVVVIKLSYE